MIISPLLLLFSSSPLPLIPNSLFLSIKLKMKIFAPLSSFPYLLCMRLIFATLADFAYQGDLHFYHVPANDVIFFFLAEQYSFLSTAHFPSLMSVEGTYLHSAGWLLSRVNDKHT